MPDRDAMPPVGGAGSDDLASSDELKVFDDEGEKEEENRAISELNELKSSLITEGEQVCPSVRHFPEALVFVLVQNTPLILDFHWTHH